MIYWFELFKPNFTELQYEISQLPNCNELEAIYHLGWEEAHNNLDAFFGVNGTHKINNYMKELSEKFGRKICFYNITASNKDFSEHIPYNGYDMEYIKVVYIPTFLFYRTIFRLGPQKVIKPPYTGALEGVYEHNKTVANADICDLYTQLEPRTFKNLYLYMTLHPKPHRCLLMDILAKYDLHKYGAISWREFDKTLDRNNIDNKKLDSSYGNYKWKHWQPRRIFLDQTFDVPGPIRYDLLPMEFNDSFVQLIGESLAEGVFLTEKTVVPLLFNKPFLIMSGKHSHKHLESLGFKLYTEIFDYSFDNESNIELRAEGIAQNLINLKAKIDSCGYLDVLQSIRDKLIYNKKHAHTTIVQNIPKEISYMYETEMLAYLRDRFAHTQTTFYDIFPYFDYSLEFSKRFI